MAITGNTTINVGLPNESTGSDSLYTAFNKINNNFSILFANASPNVVAGTGISVVSANNISTVTNTGVTSIVAGANVIVSNVGGVYTISTGDISSAGTVTSINVSPVSTSRIVCTGNPITTYGTVSVDLATTGVTAGTYTSPVITIDAYGRITSATAGAGSGTVSSVGLTPGTGIGITGGPITTSGNITVLNTGVTRLSAGPGIALSGSNGNVTITSLLAIESGVGTVTNIDITSNTLTVTGGPISTAGTFNLELAPNVSANTLTVNASTSNNLVTFTQRGTGNALVVEDVAGDTSPFVINNTGTIISGYSSSINGALFSAPSKIQTNDTYGIQEAYWGADAGGPVHQFLKARSGSKGTHGIVSNNDTLGSIFFSGSNGSAFLTGALIQSRVEGTPNGNSTNMPAYLSLSVKNTSALVERLRISAAGNVGIGTTDPQAKLHVLGKTTIESSSNIAILQFQQNTGNADNNIWHLRTFDSTGTLRLQALNDAGVGGGSVIDITKSTNQVTGVILSLNSSNTALRITQTGSGNAILVEDSSNPDATPFVVDANGTVLIGAANTTVLGPGGVSAKVSVVGGPFATYNYGASSLTWNWAAHKSKNTTIGGQTLLSNGDNMLGISAYGSDGNVFALGAQIIGEVDGTPIANANSMPGSWSFKTTGLGNTATTTRQTIYSNGQVNFNQVVSYSGSEDLADGAAANLLVTATYFTTGATGETGTLAAGSTGLTKTFMMRGDGGGDMVITVTNAGWKTSGTGTMRFDTIGDACTLQYVNSKWFCVGNNGVVFA